MQRLRERLTSGETAAYRQSISGLGGIGKTQLALEYAYRIGSYYESCLWVTAGTRAQLMGDLFECCQTSSGARGQKSANLSSSAPSMKRSTGWNTQRLATDTG